MFTESNRSLQFMAELGIQSQTHSFHSENEPTICLLDYFSLVGSPHSRLVVRQGPVSLLPANHVEPWLYEEPQSPLATIYGQIEKGGWNVQTRRTSMFQVTYKSGI